MDAKKIADELLEELEFVATDKKLDFIRRRVNNISDADTKALVEACILIGMAAGNSNKTFQPLHVVVLVHGIRTQGVWQDRVAATIEQYPNTRPIIVGFEYQDLLSFWLPYFLRKKPIARVERELRGIIQDHPDAQISVLAHSFGTYIISQILLTRPDIQFHRLLMCGAIVNRYFGWDALRCFPTGGILNDVGTKDRLPALAKMVSWGYGSSGTFGFRTHKVTDRYFDFGHSDFFTQDHIDNYWMPYLINGTIVKSTWNHERPTPPWPLSLMEFLPLKSVIIPALFFVAYKAVCLILNVC